MEYVMVPVPEELVDDVLGFLRWQTDFGSSAPPAPEVSLGREELEAVVARLDDAARDLLLLVGNPAPDSDLTLLGLAAVLASTPRELVGTVYELNLHLAEAGGLGAMMTISPLAAGETVHHRTLGLPEPVAALVREVLLPADRAPSEPDTPR
jgi:hypothetical protein